MAKGTENETNERREWTKKHLFLQGFQKIEISRGGVLFRWVLLQKKEKKDILILDTCNIISLCYFLLRKEIQRISGLQYLNSGGIYENFDN